MDHAVRVSVRNRLTNRAGNVQRIVHRQLLLPQQSFPQAPSVLIFENEVELLFGLT